MQPCKALVKTTGNGDTMQIFVKPYYRTLTLDVRPTDTVAVVKSMIHHRTIALEEAVPFYKMSLSYAGKPLARDDRTLADYGVGNLARLTFGINMSGKPPTQGPHLLCLQYPTERKAFSSDCFYKVRPSDTIGSLKLMVLAREGIVCTCLRLGYQDWVYPDGDKLSRIFGDLEALPTLRVIHYSRRARASRTVTRLATDLVREVLSYSDLRTLAAGAATCRALLEAVPPKLAHELVVRKFPILSTIVDAAKPMPPARELFESQSRLFDAPPPTVAPTRGLDEYVFSLELTVDGSNYIGTGVLDEAEAQIRFTGIPKALWDYLEEDLDGSRANVMATRKGTLRRAALYSGAVEDGDGSVLFFEWNRIPSKSATALWINTASGGHNVYYKPLLKLNWHEPARQGTGAGTCDLIAKFMWDSDDSAEDMSLEDACIVLEHWCKL